MSMRAAAVALGIALAAAGSSARGANPSEPPAPAPEAAQAKSLFLDGLKRYNLGDFKAALEAFKAAYLAKPDPVFLFNIGQCHRMTGNPRDAVYAYRRFLAEQPEAPNRKEVERLIAAGEEELSRKAAEAPPTRPLPPGEPPPAVPGGTAHSDAVKTAPAPQPIYKRWWLWTAVAGVAVVGAGVGVGIAVGTGRDAPVPASGLGAMEFGFH